MTVFIIETVTCKKCGIECKVRGGYIEADHYPKTFAEVVRENNITSFEQGTYPVRKNNL